MNCQYQSHLRPSVRLLVVSIVLVATCGSGTFAQQTTKDYYSPLHQAARDGDVQLTQQLILEDKLNVNQKNRYGLTAIYYASDRGHADVVKVLLQAGAETEIPNEPFYRLSPIIMAARKNHANVVKLLLESGAQCGSWTAIWPASLGNNEVVQTLIDMKPDVFGPETLNQLAGIAKNQNNDELLQYLIAKGAKQTEENQSQSESKSLTDAELAQIDGQYRNEDETTRLWARRGTLFFGQDLSLAIELKRISDTRFVGKQNDNLQIELRLPLGDGFVVSEADNSESTDSETLFQRVSNPEQNSNLVPSDVTGSSTTNARWNRFRGPSGNGIADGLKLPTKFDAESQTGLRWKTNIPGVGHSSPVIWNDRIFLTSAQPVNDTAEYDLRVASGFDTHVENCEYRWFAFCVDLNSGELIWQQELDRGIPKAQRHIMSSHANCTPAVDEKHLIINLAGQGVLCLDHDGHIVWRKDFGRLASGWFMDPGYEWGFASSPILENGVVYLQCDVFGSAFITAIQASTGQQIWRTKRIEISSWGTPLFVESTSDQPTQIVANGTRAVIGYEAASGKELWRINGNSEITVASPIRNGNHVIATGGYAPIRPIYSIDFSQRGDLTPGKEETDSNQPGLQWWNQKDGAYSVTPLVYRDLLYIFSSNGVVKVFESDSGKIVYKKRIASGRSGDIVASPIAANGKIYLLGGDGDIFILDAGREYHRPTVCSIGQPLMASPAAAQNRLVIRGKDDLFCFSKD
ncbi:MAG: PQQ-binding-like beta-propeller repeat protein [Planctomycetota bacterium]